METTLDKFGRVVIPKKIRDHLGLKNGEILQVEALNNEILLKPIRNESHLRVKDGVLVFSGTAKGEILEAVQAHREERLKKIVRTEKK